MAAKNRVEVPEGGNSTQPERKVSHVYMVKAACGWAKVERSAGEYAIDEVTLEIWICFEKGTQVANVIGV